MHPTSKLLDLASYYIAMSYFDQIGREDQDQSKTEQALKHFQIIEQRFPEAPFAQLATEHAQVCREMLARHHMVVGDFYFKRANFRAVESRMAELVQKYPDTPVAPEALYQLGVALEKEGKKYSAAQAFTALVKHYPDTPLTEPALKKIKQLNQPVDTEEDPLRLVLAQLGYSYDVDDAARVRVRQRSSERIGDQLASADGVAPRAADGLPPVQPTASDGASGASSNHKAEPATLTNVRLSNTDPPMSVILDVSRPVDFEKGLSNSGGASIVTIRLRDVTPEIGLRREIVFDRSIFRDAEITGGIDGTTVTLRTTPIVDYTVIPLTSPPRLLITFTPRESASDDTTHAAF
jgi:hypothetical protein